MLKRIDGLPTSVIGLRAEGKLTPSDYEKVFVPILEEAYRAGQRVHLLYQLGPEFSGFTPGAVMEDFRVGMKYLRLFERCAVVSDIEWIQAATRVFGSLVTCPTKAFKNDELKQATEWLVSTDADSLLTFELRDDGVLTVHPKGPLRREDFDKLAGVIDPWIEAHQKLNGVVVSIPKFPGWENIGSFLRHMDFIRGHHRKIRRLALAVDGALPEIVSHAASHFIEAEVRQFPFSQIEEAKKWAKG